MAHGGARLRPEGWARAAGGAARQATAPRCAPCCMPALLSSQGQALCHTSRQRRSRSARTRDPCWLRCPQVLASCSDGFAVAVFDLELRGAGQMVGKKQSGKDTSTDLKARRRRACRSMGECGAALHASAASTEACRAGPCPACTRPTHPPTHPPTHAPAHPPAPRPTQAARLPGDQELLEAAREAAAALIRAQPDPRDWPPELLGLVVDDSLLELDTLDLPTML